MMCAFGQTANPSWTHSQLSSRICGATQQTSKKRIAEIETGKPTPKTFIIGDAEIAEKKYNETLQSAKEEIIIMTSSKGLIEFWKNMPQLNELTEKGVNVKIMAPIMSENLEAAKQLSKLLLR